MPELEEKTRKLYPAHEMLRLGQCRKILEKGNYTASEIALLKEVGALLEKEGYIIENIDATIIAQRPKLAAYRPQMAKNIAEALHLEVNQVSVKATTEEGLGFTGSGEGISSQAITLLSHMRDFAADDRMVYRDDAYSGGCGGCPGCCGSKSAEE